MKNKWKTCLYCNGYGLLPDKDGELYALCTHCGGLGSIDADDDTKEPVCGSQIVAKKGDRQ